MNGSPLDLRAWTRRAELFVRNLTYLPGRWGISISVEPPISGEEVDRIAAQLPLGLPLALRRFYTEGASKLNCTYRWEPPEEVASRLESILDGEDYVFGGARILPCSNLLSHHDIAEWPWGGADTELTAEQKKDQRVWQRTVPFIAVGNGDYVGIHVADGAADQPVVYLYGNDIEGSVRRISPSFDRFLADWEALGYIGPESWLLGAFMSKVGGGTLNANGTKARQWRDVLLRADEAGND